MDMETQDVEAARMSRWMNWLFAGMLGFMAGFVLAGLLTFWKLGIPIW